jgi:hypothetical protein
LLASCVTKTIGGISADIPPNVQIYYYPKKLVWKNLIRIIRNEFLITFDYASYKKGHFVCKEIRDVEPPDLKTRVRISGSTTFDGSGVVVSIYKQIEIWNDAESRWQSRPSDFLLERAILSRLSEKLSEYAQRSGK